jgi:hypothetical protein
VPPAEATVFQRGVRNPLVDFGGNRAAVAVCADTGRPSHSQQAADGGARTYLASTFAIPSDLERDTANLRTYAVRHSMAVVFSNYGGPTDRDFEHTSLATLRLVNHAAEPSDAGIDPHYEFVGPRCTRS